MNLPILGSLFRSRDYQRQETELLIIVTPYIVHAVDPHEVVKPDANFRGRFRSADLAAGPRESSLFDAQAISQPFPNYSGKVGFIND